MAFKTYPLFRCDNCNIRNKCTFEYWYRMNKTVKCTNAK